MGQLASYFKLPEHAFKDLLAQCPIIQHLANFCDTCEFFTVDLDLAQEYLTLRTRAKLLYSLKAQTIDIVWLFFTSNVKDLCVFV